MADFLMNVPLGYQQITDVSTVQTLTVPDNTALVLLQAETKDIRWTDDGSTPDATTGMLLIAGAAPFPYTGKPKALKFIETAASGVLNASYYQ